jgi:hypothetical protein
MRDVYRMMDSIMSLRIHILHVSLGYLITNLEDLIDSHVEGFHEDICKIEGGYQVEWILTQLTNDCWQLAREAPATYKRK